MKKEAVAFYGNLNFCCSSAAPDVRRILSLMRGRCIVVGGTAASLSTVAEADDPPGRSGYVIS
jgi:hypothetical protein